MPVTGLAIHAPWNKEYIITAFIGNWNKEAHAEPDKRYTAAVSCGAIYCVIGLFGAAVTTLLAAFPKELVAAVAGLALLGTIGAGLAVAVKEESHREAALVTFLVTLSGVVIAGVSSAFWGVAAGALALFVQQSGQAKTPNP
jgi:benzoate membrane transport protein